MTAFLEAIAVEEAALKDRKDALHIEVEQIEQKLDSLAVLHDRWSPDTPVLADPPPVAKPKRSVKKIVPVRPETKPVARKKIERTDVEADALRAITEADEPIARSKVIESMKLKVTYSVVGDALDALMERGEVERIGERAGTRYGVPQRTVQQPIRPPVIPSSSAQRPAPGDRAQIGADNVVQVFETIKAHGPIAPAELRERTGIGQGGLVQAIAKLKQHGKVVTQGAGRGTKYALATERPAPANGKPAPLPPPERTALQDRLVTLVGVKPLTTKELWEELTEVPLKVEGALSALQTRGEIERRDGMWYLT